MGGEGDSPKGMLSQLERQFWTCDQTVHDNDLRMPLLSVCEAFPVFSPESKIKSQSH